MEIVCRRKPEDRALNQRDVSIVGNKRKVHGRALGFAAAWHVGLSLQQISASATRGNGSFDALVDPREICRQLSAHGMPVHTDLVCVHFRLSLQQRNGTTGGDQHKIPIAVPGGFYVIYREVIRRQRADDRAVLPGGRLRGAQGSQAEACRGAGARRAVPHRRRASGPG